MSAHRTSRRNFLKLSALAAGSSLFATNILRAEDAAKKLNFAAIGIGGKGDSDTANTAKEANIVAICDIDRDRLKKAQAKYPNAKAFESFREMFEVMGDKIDGCTVSTPDHTHFPAAMEAIKRGKHVCVQKPLVNRIWEANQLLQASLLKGVKTNMGNQGHTGEAIRLMKEWLAAGIVGEVKEIHVWTNRPVWPQGTTAKTKYATGDVPANVNWTAWLGQCPDVPYMAGLHPFAWRGHFEYGAGAMGDMGCHLLDGPFWGCELGEPYKLKAEVEELTDVSWPKASTVTLNFKSKKFGKIKLVWYEGGRKPEMPKDLPANKDWSKVKGGFLIMGDEGTIFNDGDYCSQPKLLGEGRHEKFLSSKTIEKSLERSICPGDPQVELVRAIMQNKTAGANFQYAVPLTKLCLLGNLAIANPGKTLEWDSEAQKVTNHSEANALLQRAAVRPGWDYKVESF